MHRLQSVPHVRQGAAHNHAHGVINVGMLHLIFDRHGNDFFVHGVNGFRLRRLLLRLFGIFFFFFVFFHEALCVLNIKVPHGFGVALDKLTPRLNLIAH